MRWISKRENIIIREGRKRRYSSSFIKLNATKREKMRKREKG